jgi:hypothetical protein
MKIRIIGTPDEVRAAVAALRACQVPQLDVTGVSDPYPVRSNPAHVRVYVDAQEATR